MITDKLARWGQPLRDLFPVSSLDNTAVNHRAENTHRPTRREQRMRASSLGHAPRFLAAYGPIAQYFRPRRPLLCAPNTVVSWSQDSSPGRDLTSLPTAT